MFMSQLARDYAMLVKQAQIEQYQQGFAKQASYDYAIDPQRAFENELLKQASWIQSQYYGGYQKLAAQGGGGPKGPKGPQGPNKGGNLGGGAGDSNRGGRGKEPDYDDPNYLKNLDEMIRQRNKSDAKRWKNWSEGEGWQRGQGDPRWPMNQDY
jgi:hypothetical protein